MLQLKWIFLAFENLQVSIKFVLAEIGMKYGKKKYNAQIKTKILFSFGMLESFYLPMPLFLIFTITTSLGIEGFLQVKFLQVKIFHF